MASRKKRRKRRRRRNKGHFSFLLKILTMAAVFAAMTMGATVFFQMERVEVAGNHRYTAQEIERVSGLKQGDNLFRINKYEIEEDILQALPYVEDVDISRRLPSTIQITVQEWDAVALIPASGYFEESLDEEPDAEPEETELPKVDSEDEAQEEIPESDGNEEPQEIIGEDQNIPEGEEETEDSAGNGEDTEAEEAADSGNLWLMSSGGRILERASPDSSGILIKGLYALAPKAGTQLAVSQEQQVKLHSLLQLMAALDERGNISRVSTINLSSVSEIYMYYDDRFLVKLPMTGDFDYCLYALEKVVEQRADNERGVMDLTRKDYAVVYSPE